MLARIFNRCCSSVQLLPPRVCAAAAASASAASSSACIHTAPLEAPIADYHSNGFAIVRGLLTSNDVEHLCEEMVHICRGGRGELEGLSPASPETPDDEVIARYLAIHFPHKISPVIQDLIQSPATTKSLQAIVGPNVKCMQAAGKPGQAPHQDEFFIPTRDRSLTATWIALDPATIENGCLWVIPGSHKSGIIWPCSDQDKDEYDAAPECYGYPYTEEDWVPVQLDAGDCVFFSGHLIHKSLPNKSSGFRRAFANHYMSAESLNPWTADGRFDVPPEGDLRDFVLVAGEDPYADFYPVEDRNRPWVRRDELPEGETWIEQRQARRKTTKEQSGL